MFSSQVNPAHLIDFYKVGHPNQYPEGTTFISSNFTPRGNAHLNIPKEYHNDKAVFFGLHAFLIDLHTSFQINFFNQPVSKAVNQITRRFKNALGSEGGMTERFTRLWKLGHLPIKVRALPEGTRVPMRVPYFVIENTHPDFYWLPNYLETWISCSVWRACTSATIAAAYRKLFLQYAEKTGSPKEFVSWQGHDFSFRGMAGVQDAMISGAAHLLSFTGTDTVAAIDLLELVYQANSDLELIGGSVPATEHAVMSANSMESELETYRRLITKIYPAGIVSIVSDTWDFWNVVTNIVPSLKKEIMARNGKVVLRPDSGDPVKIICGDPQAATEEERKGVVQCLWDTFGGTQTSTGHKLLDSHIGVIYGDSITFERAQAILDGLHRNGFASANVVLGIGSFTYCYNTRDTLGHAMKATFAKINGQSVPIFKKPKTDSGLKNSAKGYLSVNSDYKGNLVLVENKSNALEDYDAIKDELRIVYKNGEFLNPPTLKEIRDRLNNGLI